MKKLNSINEAIEFIYKFHTNDNIHGLILHRNPATNIRKILGIIRCNHFAVKNLSDLDISISLYDQNVKSRNKVTNNFKQKKPNHGATGVTYDLSSISIPKFDPSLLSNSYKIVNLCLTDLQIINVTDFSVDFISSTGFDFSYVANTRNADLNLMNEWIFERHRPVLAAWIRPDIIDQQNLLNELVFQKTPPKNRYLNIE